MPKKKATGGAIPKIVKKAAAKPTPKTRTPANAAAAAKASYKLGIGDKAPNFSAPSTSGAALGLKSFSGQALVIYFYPKDNTPGCTLEGHDFRKLYPQFKKAGAEVIGVSRDNMKSHEGFKAKCGFPFELLADEDGKLCGAFDVIQMKSLYGRKFLGIERSTFLVSPDGRIAAQWRKVRVAGHADEVLAAVHELKSK